MKLVITPNKLPKDLGLSSSQKSGQWLVPKIFNEIVAKPIHEVLPITLQAPN